MTRSPSHALGSSFALPILVLLGASAVEFHKFFRTSAVVADVAYAGARAGAHATSDPVVVARVAAEQRWSDADLTLPLHLDIAVQDDLPGSRISVEARVELAPVFGLVAMAPLPITCTRTMRLAGERRGHHGTSVRR